MPTKKKSSKNLKSSSNLAYQNSIFSVPWGHFKNTSDIICKGTSKPWRQDNICSEAVLPLIFPESHWGHCLNTGGIMVNSLHLSRWTTSSWFIFAWRTRRVGGDTLWQEAPSRLHIHHCWSRLGDCVQGLLRTHHQQDRGTLPLARNQNSSVGGHVALSWRFLSCLADMVQRQHRPFLSWEAHVPKYQSS